MPDQHDVAGLHQLEATGHRDALDRCDHGLLDLRHRRAGGTEGLEQRAQRVRAVAAQTLDLLEVAAGAEVAARPADHDDPHGRVVARGAHGLLEGDGERGGHGVHRFRPVEGDGGNALRDMEPDRRDPGVRSHGAHIPLPPDTSRTAPVM